MENKSIIREELERALEEVSDAVTNRLLDKLLKNTVSEDQRDSLVHDFVSQRLIKDWDSIVERYENKFKNLKSRPFLEGCEEKIKQLKEDFAKFYEYFSIFKSLLHERELEKAIRMTRSMILRHSFFDVGTQEKKEEIHNDVIEKMKQGWGFFDI